MDTTRDDEWKKLPVLDGSDICTVSLSSYFLFSTKPCHPTEKNDPSAKIRTDALLSMMVRSRRIKTKTEPAVQKIKADKVKDRLREKLRRRKEKKSDS